MRLKGDSDTQGWFMRACEQDPVIFINDWCVTYDPRREDYKVLPFVLFPRQVEFIQFLQDCLTQKEGGLVEKCRDMGASWLCCAFAVWLWLFHPGSAIGFGSRKEEYVDEKDNPKALLPKMRQIIENLPWWMQPKGFDMRKHAAYMKIINPENGSSITGEAGDNIGRGGRTTLYIKDEAQPLTAAILTPSGWRNMGDMRVGDKVIGADGNAHKIMHINDCGEFDEYCVKFNDGTETRCSPNHLWSVDKVYGNRKSLTLRLSDIVDSYRYLSPGGQLHFKYRLKLCNPVNFKKAKELPLHPYLVGALLGDGTLGSVPKHSPKITTIDHEIIEQFKTLLPDGCTIIQEKNSITWRLGDERGRMGWKHKSRSRQAVMDAGIAGKRSYEKSIPAAYLFSSQAERLALLQGLMDTDGSPSNGGSCSFHTSSKALSDDVRFLVETLGGMATLNIKKDKRGYRDQYVLHIALPLGVIPFRLTRKIARIKKRSHILERSIISIEKVGRNIMRCITIDSQDGLYLTDNLIVTHNSAHYERPELIEAALGDNTDVQIDISSVNGTANVFYRRRMAGVEWAPNKVIEKGVTRVFIMDWRDHPNKKQEWYDLRYKRAEREGLLHVFRQEVDRDYSGSIDRIIIAPEWVKAAVDAHKILKIDIVGSKRAAQDVADGGRDKNALVMAHGILLNFAEDWGDGDAGDAAKRAVPLCAAHSINELYYDCIGVGAGFKTGINNLQDLKRFPSNLRVFPWDAGAAVQNPRDRIIPHDNQSPTNEDFFYNLKAQGWWSLRTRFYKTFRAIKHGELYPHEELISLDSTMPNLHRLTLELSQAQHVYSADGRVQVDKKPDGSMSPNLADAVMMVYNPIRILSILDVI